MFLTRTELIDLAGTTRPKVIARWLRRVGIGYIVGVDGWPRVMRTVVEVKLGAHQPTAEPRLRLA
jgi:hypothetical protein